MHIRVHIVVALPAAPSPISSAYFLKRGLHFRPLKISPVVLVCSIGYRLLFFTKCFLLSFTVALRPILPLHHAERRM